MEHSTRALERWLDALNIRGERSNVDAAVHADVRIERHGWDGERGKVVQVIDGQEAVSDWLAISPPIVRFRLDGEPQAIDEDTVSVRYALAADDFEGGGQWQLRLAADGRIRWLAHIPDDVDARYSSEAYMAELSARVRADYWKQEDQDAVEED